MSKSQNSSACISPNTRPLEPPQNEPPTSQSKALTPQREKLVEFNCKYFNVISKSTTNNSALGSHSLFWTVLVVI